MKLRLMIILINFYGLVAYNKLHVSKVHAAVSSGKSVIASGGDFRGLGKAFKGKNFSNGLFSGASFAKNDTDVTPAAGTIKISGQNSDLSGCKFSNAELISVNFIGANLEGAIFDGADVRRVDFSGCNLKNASFKGTKNLDKAKFCKATLPDGTVLTNENFIIGSKFKPYCKK